MRGLKFCFLLSSFGIGLNIKGSSFDILNVLNILNILFSYFIIALFFRCRRQAGKFVSFSLSVLKFGVVLGDGGGGGGG